MDDLDPAPTTSHSGITLVLPSLRALKAANATKKSKPAKDVDQRPKIPRPVKLKPLKEVLTKLITQIKKKDDYAFFIHPVDPAKVAGYADAIKQPMDFGTMSTKVAKGKYRSLDEFTADFRLVTTNAKTFNPPGSIHYTEADRLEAWGLDHIARASAHVIEFETDWNIDVEQDDEGSQLVNVDDEVSTPRDVEGSLATGSRAPSTTPAPGQVPQPGQGRRGPRGPYKKHAPSGLSEGLDVEGRLPGAKDGVGAFTAGSDWAELMIALKIKGKRYKTKKERLRFEKEGPPYQIDGSLDYGEMEDPFSVLNVFVTEPPTRPQVTPLYPPTPATTTQPPQPSDPRIYTLSPVTVPPDRPTPVLSTLSNIPPPTITTSVPPPQKRRHWTILRNVPARSRGKDKDADATTDEAKTAWQVPHDAGPADYGTFAAFLGELTASAVGPNANAPGPAAEYVYGSEPRLFATIRSTIAHRGVKRKLDDDKGTFWTDAKAEEGWAYLRDVVYGGVDGYAYVRSLAEFVGPSAYLAEVRRGEDTGHLPPKLDADDTLPLGVPVPRYVEDNLVDAVTRGRHGWLRDVLLPAVGSVYAGSISPFHARLAALPGAAPPVAIKRSREQLDMAALIRVPEELAREGMLEGGEGVGGEREAIGRALVWSAGMIEALSRPKEGTVKVEEGAEMDVDVKEEAGEEEDPLMKRLRMNLLALAKRAPLDTIAKVPVELVPEDIRGIVPLDLPNEAV